MKLLILIIYSDGPEYQKMLKVQRSYLHKYNNVYSYFVSFRKNQEEPIEIEDDFIYVKGTEEYLRITHKTIEALEKALDIHQDIDFVIRSNISTVINIPALLDYCASLPKNNMYTGGYMQDLQWLDPQGGIHDESLWNTKYASGTSIMLSNDVAKHIVQNKQNIRHDIVDDVSIGVYIKTYLPDSYYHNYPKFLYNIEEKSGVDSRGVYFRNRTENRDTDAQQMKMIAKELYESPLVEGFSELYFTGTIFASLYYILFGLFVLFLIAFLFIWIFRPLKIMNYLRRFSFQGKRFR